MVFSLFDWYLLSLTLKTYGILKMKMFLLSAQKNFYIILSSPVQGYVKRNQVWISCLQMVSIQPCKVWMAFGKFIVELVLKSFSGRNNSLEPPDFGFLIVVYMVSGRINQESWKFWLDEFWGNRHSKMQKNLLAFLYEPFDFWFYNIIPGRFSTCKILTLS